MSISTERGHPLWVEKDPTGKLEWDQRVFHYISDDSICDENNRRPCRRCGKMPLPGGEDACIGHVPGVKGACCGHGVDDPYIGTGTFSFALRGMYTNYRDPKVWEDEVTKLDTNPDNHPINNGCVLVFTDASTGLSYWTPVEPFGKVPYCLHPSRDIPYQHSNLFSAAQGVEEMNCFKHTMRVPSIPEALIMARVLHKFAGVVNVEPFYTSQQWAGFIPIMTECNEGCLSILELYPFLCYDMRLLITCGSATEAPEFHIPEFPKYPDVNPNSSYT